MVHVVSAGSQTVPIEVSCVKDLTRPQLDCSFRLFFYRLLQSALFGDSSILGICVGSDTGFEIQCCPLFQCNGCWGLLGELEPACTCMHAHLHYTLIHVYTACRECLNEGIVFYFSCGNCRRMVYFFP